MQSDTGTVCGMECAIWRAIVHCFCSITEADLSCAEQRYGFAVYLPDLLVCIQKKDHIRILSCVAIADLLDNDHLRTAGIRRNIFLENRERQLSMGNLSAAGLWNTVEVLHRK
ncbi:hypothetical protein C823_000752 [Eubacterium plexicaudatum ASF492]|nr:hypothetical protein C823_000752 [Eubacterium plexicaudatum ASF492]